MMNSEAGNRRTTLAPTAEVAMRLSSASGISERERDEFCALVQLHPEQDRVLALAARLGKDFANLGRRCHSFAADFQNDVADLEAVLGGNAASADRGDYDPFVARAGNLAAARECESQVGHFAA